MSKDVAVTLGDLDVGYISRSWLWGWDSNP